jgi:aspartokinase
MERKHCLTAVATDSNVACLEFRGVENLALPLSELNGSTRIVADAVTHCPGIGTPTVLVSFRYADQDEFSCWVEKLQRQLVGCEIRNCDEVARVSLIGNGFSGHAEYLPRFIATLERNQIHIQHVACTDSVISALVSHEQSRRAAQLIHAEFFARVLAQSAA